MKIACLQFAPQVRHLEEVPWIISRLTPGQVGDVDNNLNRADSVLSKANVGDLDILVLPELAFSGECDLLLDRIIRDDFPSWRRLRAWSNMLLGERTSFLMNTLQATTFALCNTSALTSSQLPQALPLFGQEQLRSNIIALLPLATRKKLM